MKALLIAGVSAIALAGMSSAAMASNIIDFEEFNNGDNLVGTGPHTVPGAGITYEVSVSGPNNGQALIYDTNSSGSDPDLEAPFSPGNRSDFGNVLIFGNNKAPGQGGPNPNDDPNGGTFTFTFSEDITFVRLDLIDTGDFGAEVNIRLFDGIGNEVAAFLGEGADLNDNEWGSVSLSGFGDIASIQLTGSGAIDNFEVRMAEVPVPATLAFVAVGLAGLGAATRRHKG